MARDRCGAVCLGFLPPNLAKKFLRFLILSLFFLLIAPKLRSQENEWPREIDLPEAATFKDNHLNAGPAGLVAGDVDEGN